MKMSVADHETNLVRKPLTNDPIINYQVAIKKIGEFQQPFLMEFLNEQKKAMPDQSKILRNQEILDRLFMVRKSLKYTDTAMVEKVLRTDYLDSVCTVD